MRHKLKRAGLAAGPSTPVWVSDSHSGLASVYGGGVKGGKVSLELTVPVPGGNPTGQVFNPDAGAFHVGGTAADFIVDTDSTGKTQSPGQLEAWNGGASFVVEDSMKGGPGGKVNGKLVRHLAARGALDAPWGLAIAPKGFGPFAGDLLVGNLGNGWINAYNPVTGKYLGWLATRAGKPVAIPGLWGLEAGNAAFGGASALVFSAGPKEYGDGLVGILAPAAPSAPSGPGW
jgi:hypothetical protein